MLDCFDEFFGLFEKGELPAAIAKILPTPASSYEKLGSKEPAFHYLVNFIDAAVFGTINDAKMTLEAFCSLLPQNKSFSLKYPRSFERLWETLKNLSEAKEKGNTALVFGWNAFQKMKPPYAALIEKKRPDFSAPFYALRYFLPLPHCDFSSSTIPMIFFEPLEANFGSLISPLKERPALFVFETYADLMQALQFPEIMESLGDPSHLIYILDIYPDEQFALQPKLEMEIFQPFFCAKKKAINPALPLFLEAISSALFQRNKEHNNWLYQISKRLIFKIQEERLGMSRVAALIEKKEQENWRDPHKEMPASDKSLGPLPKDYMGLKLNEMAKKAFPRSQKLRLVHIVPQIVDGGHAPSRILENLIKEHNKDRFELFVASTERLQHHPYEYPYTYYTSEPSQIRAPQRLALFQSLGATFYFLSNELTYEKAAERIALFLHQIKADIAVFHGPDVINCMAASLTGTPLRVLFEHGTPPRYPCFDLAIMSSRAAVDIYHKLFSNIQTEAQGLPFQLDVREKWEDKPYPRKWFGLPESVPVMTTISNHLSSRLGEEMCLAIAEILKKVPNAWYAPMGRVLDDHKKAFIKFFNGHGVGERVLFLGSCNNPSQCARSMQIYLNEFPFGSCLGMLDAMAAGCPVVTMYELNGPPQSRYGGDYYGIERAVSTRKDYVDLACRLLNNSEMYQEWSLHAKRQYEKQSDVKAYVKAFEAIIENKFHQSTKDRK